MKVTLTRKLVVATDICLFELAPAEGTTLRPFTAGAHVDVHIGGFVRQYSLCNSPTERDVYRIGVLREPASRGGSVAMHACVPGTTLEISEPRNHFPLEAQATHNILLAGGIGITPLMSMAAHLHETGGSFELHYCSREPQRAAFLDRLETPPFRHRAQCYFDNDPSGKRIDFAQVLAGPEPGKHLYVCGPAGFIEAVLAAAAQAGWASGNVHREYFAAGATSSSADAAGNDGPFQVSLASSGRVVDVPAGTSIVEALRGCGVEVPVSCEQGVCGTCLTRVLSGKPDHRDVYLTAEERAANDQMLPCCSRALTPMLVLDL